MHSMPAYYPIKNLKKKEKKMPNLLRFITQNKKKKKKKPPPRNEMVWVSLDQLNK
jgi:hypothetical protein